MTRRSTPPRLGTNKASKRQPRMPGEAPVAPLAVKLHATYADWDAGVAPNPLAAYRTLFRTKAQPEIQRERQRDQSEQNYVEHGSFRNRCKLASIRCQCVPCQKSLAQRSHCEN